MTKLTSLLGRKPTLVAGTAQPAAPKAVAAASPDDPLELDQELFFPIASQLGEENELVRNLLIDAEQKITELDSIRSSLGRLVDPVSKALRAFEEAKTEKLSLQTFSSARWLCVEGIGLPYQLDPARRQLRSSDSSYRTRTTSSGSANRVRHWPEWLWCSNGHPRTRADHMAPRPPLLRERALRDPRGR